MIPVDNESHYIGYCEAVMDMQAFAHSKKYVPSYAECMEHLMEKLRNHGK